MKRLSLILGSLPFITSLCVAAGCLLPAVAQEPVASSPAPLIDAPGAATTASQGVETPAAGDGTGLSDKEKALLRKINALKTPRWRQFGPCQYDWSAWKLLHDDLRITSVQCGVTTSAVKEKAAPSAAVVDSIAVHCDALELSIKSADQPWSSWRLPYSATESSARGGEDLMVAALCANSRPIPKTQPTTPPAVTPTAKTTAKPAFTPAARPASKPAAAQKPRATKP